MTKQYKAALWSNTIILYIGYMQHQLYSANDRHEISL